MTFGLCVCCWVGCRVLTTRPLSAIVLRGIINVKQQLALSSCRWPYASLWFLQRYGAVAGHPATDVVWWPRPRCFWWLVSAMLFPWAGLETVNRLHQVICVFIPCLFGTAGSNVTVFHWCMQSNLSVFPGTARVIFDRFHLKEQERYGGVGGPHFIIL